MRDRGPARTASRRPRWAVLGVVVVIAAALIGALGYLSMESSPSAAAPSLELPLSAAETLTQPPTAGLPDHGRPAAGQADGVVPRGVTVFDDGYPAVSKLDPALLHALREAATDAASDRVTFEVDSGWRSTTYQAQLLREAIAKYGSEKEAARWVATPSTSPHVSGDAIDIGPSKAAAWLATHGAAYGLCQIYRNEPWHYELRIGADEHSCPQPYADATKDPRMQG